jgi:hypothetical protein
MNVTLTPRLVGLMVAASLAVGWMGSSLTQSPAPADTTNSGSLRPLGGQPMVVEPRTEALRQRLSEPPTPRRGRNPFVFSARAARPATFPDRTPEATPAPAVQPSMPMAPAQPVFRLSGVASTVQDGVSVLTAILNDNGAMVFAKAGDKLSRGYTVVRVEEMSVTLSDAEGVTQTIKLP